MCPDSPGGPSDREKWWGGNLIYEDAIKLLYPQGSGFWRSYYQHDTYPLDEIIKSENGHPAVGDVIAALFNHVFYGRLHVLGDIESYHFFEVAAAFLVVLGVSIITYSGFGPFAAVVASFSLAAYPLFFSESHFNIKDPPEAAFFGLTIILFYFGIVKNNWRFIIFSSVTGALAVGIKFNAFFIFPILGLWLIYCALTLIGCRKMTIRKNLAKKIQLAVSLALSPLFSALLFYVSWPYLWSDPIHKFLKIVGYYQQIGLGTPAELTKFLFHNWNTYPIIWIFYTTPIPMLIFSFIGIVASVYFSLVKKNRLAFLMLVWFAIPILRASFPNSSIYGGVRQIIEFLPAMAVLSGIGAAVFVGVFKRFRMIASIMVVLSMIFVAGEIIKIHPNENVYFNQLAGGLSGAKEKNIPYWGNSYGNAYQQGINWLNKNVEANAKLGLPISTMGNIPWIKLRSDIDFANSNWSGPARGGEYEIELDFDWSPTAWYSFAYYDKYLNPVFIAQVDDTPILKVWKNDLAHTKKGFESEKVYPAQSLKKIPRGLQIDMGKEIVLTRITIRHTSADCDVQKGGYIAISQDTINWLREPEPIDYPQVPPAAVNINANNFVFLFAAKRARYILLDTALENSCLLKEPSVEVKGLSS